MNLFVPDEENRAAQIFLEDIRSGNFAPVQNGLDPGIKAQLSPDLLKRMQTFLAQGPIKSRKIVGSRSMKTPNYTRYGITYEYEIGTRWLLAEIVLQNANRQRTIVGIHFTPMTESLEQLNRFTLFNKSPAALIFLGFAMLVPIFILGTAIVCWRTPIPTRKWLWRIFVLIGITNFTLNWTSGNIQFAPIQVQLLGAGFHKALFGPVLLQVGFPLGAVLFWIRRKAWLRATEEPSLPTA